MKIKKMAKIVYGQMPAPQNYPKNPLGQKLGRKSPEVGANYRCKSPGVRAEGGGGGVMAKLIAALELQISKFNFNGLMMQLEQFFWKIVIIFCLFLMFSTVILKIIYD